MNQNLEEHIDYLVDIMNSVKEGKVNILVGSNGSGKSLVRKSIAGRFKTYQTSLEQRTGSNASWGALSGAMRDDGWIPSSYYTITKIERLLEEEMYNERFIVIDEPELGLGEETVVALCNLLNQIFEQAQKSKDFKGALIITHNRYLVENLQAEGFFSTDVEGMTKEEWLGREITPTDLERLKENPLFEAVRDRLKKVREQDEEA